MPFLVCKTHCAS